MSENLTVEDVPREQPAPQVPVADDVRDRFPGDVAKHEMTVLRDDGLYRHLRFRQPPDPEGKAYTGAYWFDLITWPGCLAINGDMHSYLFSRTEDMFEFFRGHRPNPSYWAEKVRAGSRIREYSGDQFRRHVADALKDALEDEGAPPGLERAIREEILESLDTGWEDGARRTLEDFKHETFTGTCSCGSVAANLRQGDVHPWEIEHLRQRHRPEVKPAAAFRFEDVWEWDLSDWNYQFLWCCHAIPWGISVYDKMRAAAATVTA